MKKISVKGIGELLNSQNRDNREVVYAYMIRKIMVAPEECEIIRLEDLNRRQQSELAFVFAKEVMKLENPDFANFWRYFNSTRFEMGDLLMEVMINLAISLEGERFVGCRQLCIDFVAEGWNNTDADWIPFSLSDESFKVRYLHMMLDNAAKEPKWLESFAKHLCEEPNLVGFKYAAKLCNAMEKNSETIEKVVELFEYLGNNLPTPDLANLLETINDVIDNLKPKNGVRYAQFVAMMKKVALEMVCKFVSRKDTKVENRELLYGRVVKSCFSDQWKLQAYQQLIKMPDSFYTAELVADICELKSDEAVAKFRMQKIKLCQELINAHPKCAKEIGMKIVGWMDKGLVNTSYNLANYSHLPDQKLYSQMGELLMTVAGQQNDGELNVAVLSKVFFLAAFDPENWSIKKVKKGVKKLTGNLNDMSNWGLRFVFNDLQNILKKMKADQPGIYSEMQYMVQDFVAKWILNSEPLSEADKLEIENLGVSLQQNWPLNQWYAAQAVRFKNADQQSVAQLLAREYLG